MKKEGVILIADNDDNCFEIIQKSFRSVGLKNQIIRFRDGKGVVDFLFSDTANPKIDLRKEYVLLLDIEIPEIDGLAILKRIRNNGKLSKMPVIVLTSADVPEKIRACHDLGCNMYIVKPEDQEDFDNILEKTGRFLSIVEMPRINNTE